MKFGIIHISPVSVSFELNNESAFYAEEEYDIILNGQFIRKEKRNVASVFELTPDTDYTLSILGEQCNFHTLKADKIINVKKQGVICDGKTLQTEALQKILDESEGSLVVFDEGDYYTGPLLFHSNSCIYFRKGAQLLGSTERADYPIIEAYGIKDGVRVVNATWEGEPADAYQSLISAFDSENIMFIGEGIINGNADKSDWWINHRVKRGAWRPNNVFLNRCKNIDFVGLSICNSPCWNLHPYYSDRIRFINLYLKSDYNSPNTDGCDPESCNDVQLLGMRICVGDDCVAIKSGKYIMSQQFLRPCSNIVIRNCYMGEGHGGVVFGSESSCGIKHVDVSKCIFEDTDRGLRIKTKRGRGNKAVIEDVNFDNIVMNRVMAALVVNMHYYLSCDKYDPQIDTRGYVEVNELTPSIGVLTFKNIEMNNVKVCAGYFDGLAESNIEEINLQNINVNFDPDFTDKNAPAMSYDCEKLNHAGFYFCNVGNYTRKNVVIKGSNGPDFRFI